MKNKCNIKKAFFTKILFDNPVPLNMSLRMQPRPVTIEKMADCPVFLQNASGNPSHNVKICADYVQIIEDYLESPQL